MRIGHPLGRRVAGEYRRVLLPLAVALVANVLAFAFIVYPLAQRVANIAGREEAAALELAAAQQEYAQAEGTLTGKDRAARELERFYAEVLPANFSEARSLTYLRVPQLARQLDIDVYRRFVSGAERSRDSTLVAQRTKVELAGRYRDVRTFIHQLESAPEFVVIDNIALSEEDQESGVLDLRLDLSTYFRDSGS